MALLNELQIKGWVEIKNVNSEKEFLNETHKIGYILPHPNGECFAAWTAPVHELFPKKPGLRYWAGLPN